VATEDLDPGDEIFVESVLTHTHAHTYTHTHTHTHTLTHTHTHTHTQTDRQTHIHTHTHTQALLPMSEVECCLGCGEESCSGTCEKFGPFVDFTAAIAAVDAISEETEQPQEELRSVCASRTVLNVM
jgi:carbohydrate-binding DOMON domain-containing protein